MIESEQRITDPARITELTAKIAAWVHAQARGLRPEDAVVPEISAIEEYTVYRVLCQARTETRTVTQFSRPDKTPVTAAATVLTVGVPELWEIPSEPVAGFINFRATADVPGSLAAAACASCAGAGTVTCPECLGKKGIWCSDCRGDGKIVCPECKRTRSMPCKKCSGHGKVYKEHLQHYDTCETCQGKGDVPCDACTNGYIACRACQGKGRVPCGRCGEQGTVPCAACGGQGQIVSGLALDVVHHVHEARKEMGSDDVPVAFWRAHGADTAWVPAARYTGAVCDDAAVRSAGIPAAVMPQVAAFRALLPAAADTRVAAVLVAVEKKTVYCLRYAAGETTQSCWMAESAAGVVLEQHFLTDVYATVLQGLRAALQRGETAAVLADATALQSAGILRQETAAIIRAARRKTAVAYGAGSAGAAALVLAAGIPVLLRWRGASFHVHLLVGMVVLGTIVIALGCAGALFLLRLPRLRTLQQQGSAAAVLSLLLVAGAAAGLVMAGVDPAAAGDRRAAQAAYTAWFPFGLRTLSKQEDIQFLRTLIKKYTPTGIDLSLYKKDLAWLEEKQRADALNIARLQRAAQEIEARAQKPAPRPVRRARSRISIR